MSALGDQIAHLVTPTLQAMGFDLVRVQLLGNRHMTLQIMAEPIVDRSMTIEDCAEISRAISTILDVEDPIRGTYSLEISSPGIDRPLTRAQDFRRFQGHEAKIEIAEPIEGRKRFKGTIVSADDGKVALLCEGETIDLPIDRIHKAKLVLTDALIALYQRKEAQDAASGEVEVEA